MKQYKVLNQLKKEWIEVVAESPVQAIWVASVQTIGINATRRQETIFGFCCVSLGQFILYL